VLYARTSGPAPAGACSQQDFRKLKLDSEPKLAGLLSQRAYSRSGRTAGLGKKIFDKIRGILASMNMTRRSEAKSAEFPGVFGNQWL